MKEMVNENIINLENFDPVTLFNLKKEVYLYLTAKILFENKSGDPEKLQKYMSERIDIIEKIAKVCRPFKVVEKGTTLMEVS